MAYPAYGSGSTSGLESSQLPRYPYQPPGMPQAPGRLPQPSQQYSPYEVPPQTPFNAFQGSTGYQQPGSPNFYPIPGKPSSGGSTSYSQFTGNRITPQQMNAEGMNTTGRGMQLYAAQQALAAMNPLAAGQHAIEANSIANQRNAPTQQQLMGVGGPFGFGPAAGLGMAYPQIQPVSSPSTTAYDNAAFAAAKARAGQLGRSALDTLQGQLADRGMLGSGVEARGLTDILAASTNPLSDVNVAQLGQNIGIGQHALDLGAQQAAQQFQGGLTARGQDIGLLESENQLAAQQAIAQQNRQQQLLQAALGGLSNLSY